MHPLIRELLISFINKKKRERKKKINKHFTTVELQLILASGHFSAIISRSIIITPPGEYINITRNATDAISVDSNISK